MKTKTILLITTAALCGCMKIQRTDEQASSQKRTAPPGHYFLTRAYSTETVDGVTGFPSGTEVQFLSRDGKKLNVLAKNEVLTVNPGDLTNDMDSGAAMARAEAARQAFAIDDHSRLAFACLLPDEKTPSVLCALEQAVSFYREHGISIQRVLTDRGSTYRSKLFAAACQKLGLKHRFTRPYRPQTNGKAERFIQTITREWAYARPYDSSDHRASFLNHYLHDYNFHRPHSALNSMPPSSRLPQTADNVSRYNS